MGQRIEQARLALPGASSTFIDVFTCAPGTRLKHWVCDRKGAPIADPAIPDGL